MRLQKVAPCGRRFCCCFPWAAHYEKSRPYRAPFLLLLTVGCALFECLPTVMKNHALRADAAARLGRALRATFNEQRTIDNVQLSAACGRMPLRGLVTPCGQPSIYNEQLSTACRRIYGESYRLFCLFNRALTIRCVCRRLICAIQESLFFQFTYLMYDMLSFNFQFSQFLCGIVCVVS